MWNNPHFSLWNFHICSDKIEKLSIRRLNSSRVCQSLGLSVTIYVDGRKPTSPVPYFILRLTSITLTRTSVLYLPTWYNTDTVRSPLRLIHFWRVHSSPCVPSSLYTRHIVNFSIQRPPLVLAALPTFQNFLLLSCVCDWIVNIIWFRGF